MHTARHTHRADVFAAIFLAALLVTCTLPARADQTAAPAKACLQAHTDAQVLRKEGLLIEARERLLRCAQSDCPPVVIDDCADWLPSLEKSIPTAVFAISDPQGHDLVEAKVLAQGRVIAERANGRAVALNPGVYTLEIVAEGFVTVSERLVMRESEKNRIVRVTLQPMAAETALPGQQPRAEGMKPIPTASWILAGAALGSGIVFGVSGLLYLSAKSDIENTRCSAGDAACERERRDIADRGKTYTTIDRIAGPVAAASLLAAVVVYIVSDSAPDDAQASQLRLHASAAPGVAEVQLRGRF